MKIYEKMLQIMRSKEALTRTNDVRSATETIQRTMENLISGVGKASSSTSAFSPKTYSTGTGVPNFVNDLLSELGSITNKTAFDSPLESEQDQKVDVSDGGRFMNASYTHSTGTTHRYKLYIPSCYHGQSLPLIVMLHGCTQNPDDFAAGTGANALAEKNECFIVYPAQTSSANQSKCWNWFKKADQEHGQGEPAMIAGLTQEVMNTYNIDKKKVYIAGLSAGGAMALIMATTYSDLYAAAGVHSGLPYKAAQDVTSALTIMKSGKTPNRIPTTEKMIPLIIFHGDRDTTVHPLHGENIVMQSNTRDKEILIENGSVPNGYPYTRTLYHDKGNVTIEYWLIHGAGHAWSGGNSKGSYTDIKGPNATKEMIRFFLHK